ncbi:MAG: hypothetical protein K0R14_534 [Burkholderiales bacterium]|jgi:hypothetical protein|nr:hypothetical protein [Burkholderiales bacterium]
MQKFKLNGVLIALVALTLIPTIVIADGTSSISVGPDGVHATTTTTTTTTKYRGKPKNHGKSKKPKLNDNGHNGNNGVGYSRNHSQN